MAKQTIKLNEQQRVASLDDFFVKRDEAGTLLPVKVETKHPVTDEVVGTIEVLPMSDGVINTYWHDDRASRDFSDEEMAEIFDSHLWWPHPKRVDEKRFEGIDTINVEFMRDQFKPFTRAMFMRAIMEGSGIAVNVDVDDTGTVTATLDDEGK